MNNVPIYRAGSRKSELALIQTNTVVTILKIHQPNCNLHVVSMSTKGDNILDKPLAKVGKNVFTKELEDKLSVKDVDIVVHSLKDVSTTLPEGLVIGAVLEREDPRDAVLTRVDMKGKTLDDLPNGSVIGTSSLRRAAQIRRRYPHLVVRDIRGNLNTRLQKLDRPDSDYTAIVLALAGIRRMGWEDRVSEILDTEKMLYAVGQGALAVQCRSDDTQMLSLLQPLSHCDTTLCIVAERSFMQTLGGGCTAPLAVSSSLDKSILTLTGGVWRLDGTNFLLKTVQTTLEDDTGEPPRKCAHQEPLHFSGIAPQDINFHHLKAANNLGIELALILKDLGAVEIIEEAKRELAGPVTS